MQVLFHRRTCTLHVLTVVYAFPYQHCCSFLPIVLHHYELLPYTFPAGNTNYDYATVSEKLEPVSSNFLTLESSMYEVPVPQQRNVSSTLEPSDVMYEIGETKVSETL